ncbi:ExbD/TolR family protein [Pseudoalteromonas prydzensis]|uniref:Biopolymer transporter ExbD n=1 Tax=Pseudoalteromonas prydzensis TaxID=182141 RepID=A0ABR9FJQ6_9GAMM|nr:biopolymer transporter ExbD [Pseudoalteromonas prydzensis]MBE0457056.1 biopolymer transporter ExbD [Pseudoalteromonas prydzensis]
MAFGQQIDEEEQMMAEINMTPFVDVMLVLLIIFIIAMPVITQSIIVELPKAHLSQSELTEQAENISLVVMANGNIRWQQQDIDIAELKNNLRKIAQQSPQPILQLQGAAKVPYEKVVQVMALAQESGVNSLNFVTQLP